MVHTPYGVKQWYWLDLIWYDWNVLVVVLPLFTLSLDIYSPWPDKVWRCLRSQSCWSWANSPIHCLCWDVWTWPGISCEKHWGSARNSISTRVQCSRLCWVWLSTAQSWWLVQCTWHQRGWCAKQLAAASHLFLGAFSDDQIIIIYTYILYIIILIYYIIVIYYTHTHACISTAGISVYVWNAETDHMHIHTVHM